MMDTAGGSYYFVNGPHVAATPPSHRDDQSDIIASAPFVRHLPAGYFVSSHLLSFHQNVGQNLADLMKNHPG